MDLGEEEAQEAGLVGTVGLAAEAGGRVTAGTRGEVRRGAPASVVAEAAVVVTRVTICCIIMCIISTRVDKVPVVAEVTRLGVLFVENLRSQFSLGCVFYRA